VDQPPEDADDPILLPPQLEAAVWADRFDIHFLLQAMWAAYARRSMPREVDDDDET
jgi:hypothetical protein